MKNCRVCSEKPYSDFVCPSCLEKFKNRKDIIIKNGLPYSVVDKNYKGCSPEAELSQLKGWISVLRKADSEPFSLEDLDEKTLRIRLLPSVGACMWNNGKERLKRKKFYKHLKNLNKKELLEIHCKREERKRRKNFSDPIKISHIRYRAEIERHYGLERAMLT